MQPVICRLFLFLRREVKHWKKYCSTAGNDSTDLNNTVRSFDIISYTAYFKSKVRDNAPYAAYETGTLHFEFILPGTAEQAQFETGSMGWLSAKKEVQYEITESTYNDQPCQVLRGSYLWEPSDENPSAIGESYQELTLVVRALALKNGDTLKPEFTFWLDYNDVPEEGLVTGSNHSCSEHGEIEYKTITGSEVRVTAAPRYNVQVKEGRTEDQQLGTFDFSTGNDLAQNRDAGEVTGRVGVYGVTIQIQGKSAQHGLRGCELPDGQPITLDLVLRATFTITFITTPPPRIAPGSFITSSAPALRCGGSLTGCASSMSCLLFKIRNSTARAVFSTMASGSGKSRPLHNSGCGGPSWRPWGKSPPTFRRSCGLWRSPALR